jgi:hypothetical protein
MPSPFKLDDIDLDAYDEGEAYYAIGRNVSLPSAQTFLFRSETWRTLR